MNAANLEAYRRMMRAGFRPRAIQSRIQLIAHERNLPQNVVKLALTWAKTDHDRLLDLALEHLPDVNLDWLFYGDICGLIAMRRVS